MGLSLEFYLGDVEKIMNIVQELELEQLNDQCVQKYADFSLHLRPQDLDTLSLQFGKYSGLSPIPLESSLSVLIDSPDGGLFLVEEDWVNYIGTTNKNDIPKITTDWFTCLKKQYPKEEIEETVEALAAVRALVELCTTPPKEGYAVLHRWYP